jgi:ATP-dependent Clp protease adaptor protein ClpS
MRGEGQGTAEVTDGFTHRTDDFSVGSVLSDRRSKCLDVLDARSEALPIFAAKEPQRGGDQGPGSGTAVITRPKTQTRRPSMYRVLLLNDDYTPMEFVVTVLKKYFNKGPEEATRIMLHVHQHGVGECGVFTYEVAETKVTQVMDYARKHQHPLQCIMEKK